MSTCILWFRNNLRLGDNMPVAEAYARFDTVIPVYVLSDSQHSSRWTEPGMGTHRARFLVESLEDLNHGLNKIE